MRGSSQTPGGAVLRLRGRGADLRVRCGRKATPAVRVHVEGAARCPFFPNVSISRAAMPQSGPPAGQASKVVRLAPFPGGRFRSVRFVDWILVSADERCKNVHVLFPLKRPPLYTFRISIVPA